MCGLVGVMGDITAVDKIVFNQLLVVDVLRGKHSTGAALVDYRGVTSVFKKAVNVQDFLDFTKYKDLQRLSYNCMIGHNRYATKGAVNNVNAHPFDFQNVVGVHNGTLHQYHNLDNAKDFEVDSECMYSHLNDHGIQDTFEKVVGALALVWFDKKTKKLHFFRNSERPLSYCYSSDKATLYWASESWMLRGILSRNGIQHTEIVSISEEVLYSFDVPDKYATKGVVLSPPKVVKLTKPTLVKKSNVTSLPVKKGSVGSLQGNLSSYLAKEVEVCIDGDFVDEHNNPYIGGFLSMDTLVDVRLYVHQHSDMWDYLLEKMDLGNFSVTIVGTSSHNAINPYLRADLRTITYCGDEYLPADTKSEDENLVDGYAGKKLTYTEFHAAAKKGCAWCADVAVFRDSVKWVANDEFVCSVCQEQSEVMGWIEEGFGGNS